MMVRPVTFRVALIVVADLTAYLLLPVERCMLRGDCKTIIFSNRTGRLERNDCAVYIGMPRIALYDRSIFRRDVYIINAIDVAHLTKPDDVYPAADMIATFHIFYRRAFAVCYAPIAVKHFFVDDVERCREIERRCGVAQQHCKKKQWDCLHINPTNIPRRINNTGGAIIATTTLLRRSIPVLTWSASFFASPMA